MASILIRLIFIILGLWLLRVVLAKVFGVSKPPRSSETPSKNMVKDPVCGMYMDSRLAVRLQSRNEAFYFCSEECRNKYLGKSSAAGSSSPPPM